MLGFRDLRIWGFEISEMKGSWVGLGWEIAGELGVGD